MKDNMFALPVSILDNKEFMEMYKKDVKGAITDEKLDDDVDKTIKEFFNDLYEVLRLKTKKLRENTLKVMIFPKVQRLEINMKQMKSKNRLHSMFLIEAQKGNQKVRPLLIGLKQLEQIN